MAILRTCVFLVSVLGYCLGANILYLIPFTAKSHYIMQRPIGLELSYRGHNVTVVTAHKEVEHPPNYHQVMVDNKQIWDVLGIKRPNVFTMVDMTSEEFHKNILWSGGLAFTEVALNSSEVQKFLKQDHTFDLVISEQFFQESMYVLAHKYNAPLILITTFGNCMRHNIISRNPLQLSTVVSEFLDVREPMSFWGRMRNFYFTLYEFVVWKYWYLEKQEALVKKYIPNLREPVPSLYDIQKNTSLMLINGHFSFDNAAAYGPNIIEIGGLHLTLTRSNVSLPKDLQNLLDGAKNGVVYVNFGSNVRSSELPIDKKNAFLNVFRRLKQTVIWKWEEDSLENKPDNLFIRKWLPQKEILSHPNIKVFISHGGLIGTQEAIFHGVPIVGIPIYADQFNNLLQAQEIGFGRILEYHSINEENLWNILNDVLKSSSYKNKAREVSARFKDRPMSAIDTAMFWIEYVLRNKGAPYMKTPGLKLNWFAHHMLDVYAFIFTLFIALIFVIKIIISTILFKKESPKRENKKKYN
ncbi:UDP-glycosyltransferase UGT5-like [Galleria mellonella]|uniref:UDP-glucuronosyltransferase n=1 Tax=Galleria mellonella TaxID=7137 RepID=A0A6J1X6I8_GALME|nr:UDP-glycosyltransferase UGT5-like [Galleria mellonella]